MGYFKEKIKNLKLFSYRNQKGKPSPYEPLERIAATCQQIEDGERILYSGNSVVERVSRGHADETPLGQFVAKRLRPRYTTGVISHSAHRPGICLAISRTLASAPKKPSLVILPINMRCFSPQ